MMGLKMSINIDHREYAHFRCRSMVIGCSHKMPGVPYIGIRSNWKVRGQGSGNSARANL